MKRFFLCLIAVLLSASPSQGAGVTLVIRNGLVSLDAQDATVRQILTEWATLGRTQIVNMERVASAPMTIQFENLPEKQALEIILRNVPGYVAAPRAAVLEGASTYEKILIMATTTQVAARPPQANPGLPGSAPGLTQLRPQPPAVMPGNLPEPAEPPDPRNDPAIAAAAAAGLVAMPGTQLPGTFAPVVTGPAVAAPSQPPATATPANPFYVPPGTSQLSPPTPAAPAAPPLLPPRPPQADR